MLAEVSYTTLNLKDNDSPHKRNKNMYTESQIVCFVASITYTELNLTTMRHAIISLTTVFLPKLWAG